MSFLPKFALVLSVSAGLCAHGASAQSAELVTAAEGLVRAAMKNCSLALSDREAYLAEVEQRSLNGFVRRAGKTIDGEVTASNYLSGNTMPHDYFNERVVLTGEGASLAGFCTMDRSMSMDADENAEALQKAIAAIDPNLKLRGGKMDDAALEPLPEFDDMSVIHQYSYVVDGWSDDPAVTALIRIEYNALEIHVFRTPS